MTFRRAAGLLAALSLIARFVIVDSSWGDSIVCGALALSCGVVMTLAFRAGRASASELTFAWLSAIAYAAGGTYLDRWSGEGDIGGVVPGLLGFMGILTIAVAMNLPGSRHSPTER
jgi:drug/metabolite transporter (DMT)-like permease